MATTPEVSTLVKEASGTRVVFFGGLLHQNEIVGYCRPLKNTPPSEYSRKVP